MWFFTSDEHYFHKNVIKYCNRPFVDLKEMHDELISRNNKIVKDSDIVVHLGDTSFERMKRTMDEIISKLNGNHIFLKGSHDKWLDEEFSQIWEKKIDNNYIVCCHYCLQIWPRSHYNSWHLFGHSHGYLDNITGKRLDIGVDTNNYYPYSLEQIKSIMSKKEDNPNLVKKIF